MILICHGVHSLTDAPPLGTTVTANVIVEGNLPGNAMDASEFVTVSATHFTFNHTHYARPERFLQVNVSGRGWPGDSRAMQIEA